MQERLFERIRRLPRNELEAFAIRAAAYIRSQREDNDPSRFFLAILAGFLLGALVASSGFLLGAGFG